MPPRRNFADPDYEPTDEDLAELIHEAFAGLAEQREQSLRDMRARIAARSLQVEREFDTRHKPITSTP